MIIILIGAVKYHHYNYKNNNQEKTKTARKHRRYCSCHPAPKCLTLCNKTFVKVLKQMTVLLKQQLKITKLVKLWAKVLSVKSILRSIDYL